MYKLKCACVLCTNVRDEHVPQISRLSANFAVEIQPPRGQSALLYHCLHIYIVLNMYMYTEKGKRKQAAKTTPFTLGQKELDTGYLALKNWDQWV